MDEQARSSGLTHGLAAPLIAAIVFGLLAWGSVEFTRGAGRIAALWLPNAFLVGLMLRESPARMGWFLAPSYFANVAANLIAGDTAGHAFGVAFCNSVEITIVVLGLRWACGTRPNLAELKSLAWLALIGGIVAPAISGVLAMTILTPRGRFLAPDVWLNWVLADGLGLLVVTPVLTTLLDGFHQARALSRRSAIEWAAILLLGTLSIIALFSQSRFPLLFMAVPFVMLAAFRLGALGAAIATTIIAVIASIATANNLGPIQLVQADLSTKVLVLQTFLLVTFASALPVAAALNTLRTVERQLRESRDFAQSILENMREIVFRTDSEGRWTFLNSAWTVITGYSVAECLGRSTAHLLDEGDLEAAKRIYPRLASGEINECVLRQRFKRADGTSRDIEASVRAMHDADGKFIGTSGNIRDITEERASIAALEASEERFRKLADAAPVGIYRSGPDADITYVNPAWTRITGLNESETLGHRWRDALLNVDEFERRPKGTGLDGPDDIATRDLNILRPDGRQTWIRVVSAAEFDAAGVRVGFIGVVADITERKQAELAIARSEEQLKLFAENVTDAVFRLSLDGRCLFVTPSVKDVLGFAPEQLIGHDMLTRFHPDDAAAVHEAYAALASGKVEATTVTYRSLRAGGHDEWVWLEASSKLVRDAAMHAPMEIIASIRDVTRRKELEIQRNEALRRAEDAADAKASFLANMSHEIRTPMNGVIGFTELLLESDLDDEQRKHAQLIAESGRTMMRLLNDILDLSKIDAGKMTIVHETIDIHHVLNSSLRLMSVAAERKGLSLKLEIADEVPRYVMGDSLRLRQILANLIGNAIKFTPLGGITLKAHIVEDDAKYCVIEVIDTGIGIEPERQKAIFDVFVQESDSTAKRFGGTGLGLAISRRLATLMGGTLNVRSMPGWGTTMILSLPLVETEPGTSKPARTALGATPRAHAAGSCHVLVAEDHDINQMLVTALLRRLGCTVHVAPDGAAAIARVEEATAAGRPYQMVLMDMQMPEVDGLQATRRLRALGYDAATLPIVALTANAFEDDIAACIAAGMQGHLAKPIQLAELQAVLDRFAVTSAEPAPQKGDDPAVERLRKRYESFRDKAFDAFTAALTDDAPIDSAGRAELHMLAHKLAGTAAMFGETSVGDAARVLDDALKDKADDVALRVLLRACLDQLGPAEPDAREAVSRG